MVLKRLHPALFQQEIYAHWFLVQIRCHLKRRGALDLVKFEIVYQNSCCQKFESEMLAHLRQSSPLESGWAVKL